MLNLLNKINNAVWSTPTLLLVFFTGVILSVRTGFFQIRFFKSSLKEFFKKSYNRDGKHMSPFQSACTALCATMGTGNIIGVAGALILGGPGAVFWMWVSALFCMIIKFSEIVLGVRYREKDRKNTYCGGAMYYMKNALPQIFMPLAYIFCFCGILASFGVGNAVQISTVATNVTLFARSLTLVTPIGSFFIKLTAGIICAAICLLVLKNDSSVGKFCEKLMPLMTVLYIAMTLGAIFANYKNIPAAFLQIFAGAFSPKSITGGAIGSAFISMRFGMSRGVFSNESGLGTASIAYACSEGDEVKLGLMGIAEVFIDTIVVCTLTALTILCADDLNFNANSYTDLTYNALAGVYGNKIIFLFCPIVCFFAFSSVVGWGLYGTKFAVFLFGEKSKNGFLTIFIGLMIPAAVLGADAIWLIAEIFNGVMILPNTTALLCLSNEISNITHIFTKKSRLAKGESGFLIYQTKRRDN